MEFFQTCAGVRQSQEVRQEGENRFRYARELHADGYLVRARQLLQDFLILFPDHVRRFQVLELLAEIEVEQDHPERAALAYRRAYASVPGEDRGLEAALKAGRILAGLGRFGEARALFREIQAAGKHLALMAHYNHWQELEPAIAREAIRRIRDTGAQIRAQGPLLAHINDDAATWARLWSDEVKLGIYPYYMFVERDTGAKRYFEVPLVKAWEIYRDAMQQVSGIARTARGPGSALDVRSSYELKSSVT